MKVKGLNFKSSFLKLVILIFFGILLFVSTGIEVTYQGTIYVNYVLGDKSLYILVLGLVGLIGSLIFSNSYMVRFDKVTKLLSIRIVLFVLSNIIILTFGLVNTTFQSGILLAYIVCLIFYYLGSSIDCKHFLSNLCFLSICIITAQLIQTFVGRQFGFSDTNNMKWWMVIPIGQTNTVGCYVFGMLVYYWCSSDKKIVKCISLFLSITAILLTYSRSGLIMLLVFILYLIISDLRHSKHNKAIKVVLYFLIVLCVLMIFVTNFVDVFGRFTFNSMSATRLKVYSEGFRLFLNNIVTGVGAYQFHIYDAYKAHNWILESFIESGLVGGVLYVYTMYKVYKSIKLRNINMLPFFLFYLIHGLVEPNLFSTTFDAFFWLLVGSCLFKSGQDMFFYDGGINENSMHIK